MGGSQKWVSDYAKLNSVSFRLFCYYAAMKIKLMFVTLLLAFTVLVMAQSPEPEQASTAIEASEASQTPDVVPEPDPDKAKVLSELDRFPTIPDLMDPAEKLIFQSAFDGNLAGVQAAVTKGVPVNIADQKKRTPLIMAAFGGHTAVVKYLVSEGADINSKDGDNQTALMYASKRSFNEIAAFLLKNDAEVNVRSKKKGITALMLAAVWDNVELVNMLLEHGADVKLTDAYGRTAEALAQKKGNSAVVAILSNTANSEAES